MRIGPSFLLCLLFALLCHMALAQNPSLKQVQENPFLVNFQASSRLNQSAGPLNTCNTWTFRLQFSSAASEQPTDAIQLLNNNYIICGNDSSTSVIRGRLFKLNAQGQLLISKAFDVPGMQLRLHRLRYFQNNLVYVIGTLTDPANSTTRPVMLSIDTTSLALVSIVRLNVNSGPANWKGLDLAQSNDRTGCFLLSYNDSLLNVTRLATASNTVAWSRTYKPRHAPRPVGIGAEFQDVYITWNETDSGYSKAVLMSLYEANGNYHWGSRAGGLGDSMNIELQSMTMVNLRARVTGIQWKNNVYQPIRMNYETTSYPTFREIFSIASFAAGPGMRSGQDNFGEMMAFQQGDNAIQAVSDWVDNYNTPISGWRLDYPYPVELNRVTETTDGSSLVLARTQGYPQRMILTKTDTVGTMPGCSVTGIAASFQRIQQPYRMDTLYDAPFAQQAASFAINVNDVPVMVTEDCRNLYCPSPPQPDSCVRTFFKEYINYYNCIGSVGHLTLSPGKFLVRGVTATSSPYTGMRSNQFTIMDTMGRLLDSRQLESTQSINVINMIRLSDGNIFCTGLVNNGGLFNPIFLIKFDPQFNIIWQKLLATPSGPQFNAIEAILESSEGDLYCYMRDRIATSTENRTIVKLDASGNPIWSHQYSVGPSFFASTNEFIPALVESGGEIIAKYNDGSGDFSPNLMKIRKSDGGLIWVRKYQMSPPFNGSNSFSLYGLISDGNVIYMNGRSQDRNLVLKIGGDGSVLLSKRSPITSFSVAGMNFKSNGRLLSGANWTIPGGAVYGIIEYDTDFNILRKQYMRLPGGGRISSLEPYSDSVTYATGSLYHPNNYWGSMFFQKFNFNSNFGSCEVNESLLQLDPYSQPVTVPTLNHAALPLPVMSSYNASFTPAYLAFSHYLCGNNSSCTQVDLQGPVTICDTVNTYSFPFVRNPGCGGMSLWSLDTVPGQIRIVSINDTMVKIKPNLGGSFHIRTRVFATCGWLEDSLTVQVTAGVTVLNLGPDRILCAGNTISLHAGPGFGSYLWQDGSTDSVFTVTQPGSYYVQVSSCGNILRDSVLVTAAAPIPFDLGPDRTKCNNDTIHLNAPSGFLNYSWSNNYQISSLTSQNVVVNPQVDTSYYVKAEKTPGCFAYDTVRVIVRHSLPVDLGSDRSFCSGDSALFNAGSGFSQYQWSNGASVQQITVHAAGTYSVIATSSDGCKSYDTVRVINVFSNPVVSLDHTPSICTGTTRVLDAGNFSSYSWNTGSNSQTIVVSGIGVYAVEVKDNNGCKGRDTTTITELLPLPEHFLPADTAICAYSTISLKAGSNYNSYLWNNGSTSSSISISSPGLYWLQVKDNRNCIGKDSIVVDPKDCMKDLFVPTAFTPNGDGTNDIFRALLFGNIRSFEFTIYNRWGQIVFNTKDSHRGWDGTVGGKKQDTGVFVWICRYQLEGEGEKMQKGLVTLIR